MTNERLNALMIQACHKRLLKKMVFSKPDDPTTLRTVVTPRAIGGAYTLQAECFTADNKARHENFAPDDDARLLRLIDGHAQVNLITTVGDCEYKRAKSGKCTLLRERELAAAMDRADAEALPTLSNNRQKRYLLQGNEPFLQALGVSDKNGRVYDKKQAKFRQINKFLEFVKDAEAKLPADKTLDVVDLCCGKSYLSFAVYHYFVNMAGRRVRMVGVDLKADVIRYCSEVAEKLHFDGLSFVCGDITAFEAPGKPDLVLSLHACDTATDIVLDRAAAWGAKVILSTPCCHHELNHTLNCPTLSFIADHSILRQKLCEAATDAMRLKRLEAAGYSVTAIEFIDPDETPKNTMLRAVRTSSADAPAARAAAAEYESIRAFLLGGKDSAL